MNNMAHEDTGQEEQVPPVLGEILGSIATSDIREGLPQTVIEAIVYFAKVWHKSRSEQDWKTYFTLYQTTAKKFGEKVTSLSVEKYMQQRIFG